MSNIIVTKLMAGDRAAIQYPEGQKVLFESSFRAIPFNIVMATILAASLIYNQLPLKVVLSWYIAIIVVSVLRMIYCKVVIVRNLLATSANLQLKVFLVLTGIMGLVWTAIYFLSLPYASQIELYLILLVCGGMAAGSTASLGVYLTAFFTYIFSIFLPIIVYSYALRDVNDFIFATMFVFFLLAITIIAFAHQKLFAHIFFLTEQNKALMEKFEMLSITDALTGLFNRRHFATIINDEYNRAKRNHHPLALVSIDVDNFKLVNDNLGHPFGDQFLVYIAQFLKSYLKRANDVIFRLGGDEFAVLLINVSEENTRLLCSKIRDEFLKNPPFEYTPHDTMRQAVLEQVSLSIGAIYVPYDSSADVAQVVAMADQLLYQSKHEGKNKFNYRKAM